MKGRCIMSFEVIKLTDATSLSTFAYIQCTGNRYDVFCDYIQYCFIKHSTKMTREDLRSTLTTYFSISMPLSFCDFCLHRLEVDKILSHRDTLYTLENPTFDADAYEKQLEELQVEETKLNESFRSYAELKNKNWSLEEASNVLSSFIFSGNVASNIFVNRKIVLEDIDENSLIIPNSWYAGSFIVAILNGSVPESDKLKCYLLKVITGVMICLAVGDNTEDIQMHRKQRKTNSIYYLDTRLALRCLGYSDRLHIEETKELVDLIRKDQGTLAVTTITLAEVQSALYNAYDSLAKRTRVQDEELYDYCLNTKISPSVMKGLCSSAPELMKKYGFILDDEKIDWSTSVAKSHNIDCAEFRNHIKSLHANWNDQAIENDVSVISYIYYKRLSSRNSSVYFVTSNTQLVYCTKSFFSNLKLLKSQLPVISNITLLCKLWLPVYDKLSNIPQMILAERAYAAKQPTPEFCLKMQEIIRQYSEITRTNLVFNSEEDSDKFEDYLITLSSGNVADFTGQDLCDYEATLKDTINTTERTLAISLAERTLSDKRIKWSRVTAHLLHAVSFLISGLISLISLLLGAIFGYVGVLAAVGICILSFILGAFSYNTGRFANACLLKYRKYFVEHIINRYNAMISPRNEYSVSDTVSIAAKELLQTRIDRVFKGIFKAG